MDSSSTITIDEIEILIRGALKKMGKLSIDERKKLSAILDEHTECPISSVPNDILGIIIELAGNVKSRYVCKNWKELSSKKGKILPRGTPENIKKAWIIVYLLKHTLRKAVISHKWCSDGLVHSISATLRWSDEKNLIGLSFEEKYNNTKELFLARFPFEEIESNIFVSPEAFARNAHVFLGDLYPSEFYSSVSCEGVKDLIFFGSMYYTFCPWMAQGDGIKKPEELRRLFSAADIPESFWYNPLEGKLWENEEFQEAVCRIPKEFE